MHTLVLPLRLLLPASALASPASLRAFTDAGLAAIKPATQSCQIYGIDVINCYEGPGEGFSAKATIHGGHFYQCSCFKTGDDIDGNSNWDFIPDNSLPGGGCYVPQYYTTQPCGNCK